MLPAPLGMAVPIVTRVAGASAAACRGLALLATSAFVHEIRTRNRPTAHPTPGAVKLTGRWRRLVGKSDAIETDRATITVVRAAGIRAPPPGTPVEALARTRGNAGPMIVSLRATGPVSGALIDRWRIVCGDRINVLLQGPARGLARALLLGDRSELQQPIRRHCRRTGTMHLLALSGLHVGLVAMILSRVLHLSGWSGAPLTGALLMAFVLLAGARAPLLRAAQGWLLLTFGRSNGRESSPLHRLTAVACVLLVADPAVAHELGAQLSFVAVAGLLAAMPLVSGPARALVAPAGAVLATAPLCVEAFGELQPLGILVTLVLLPLVGCVLTLGVCCVLTGPLTAALDPISAPLLQFAADAFLMGETTLAALVPDPLMPPVLPFPPLLMAAAIIASLIMLGHRLRGPIPP